VGGQNIWFGYYYVRLASRKRGGKERKEHEIAIGRRVWSIRRERRFVCGILANQKSSLPKDFDYETV
jgi:hypothetical protein